MKKPVFAALPAALALAFAPGAQAAQDLTPEGRGAYVAVAGATDLYEIRSAEVALEKAQRPEVRDFAQTMLTEHTESSEQLADTAEAVGLNEQLPLAMMPMHWDMLRRLERASGSRFDGIYIDQQVETHEVALELHRNFAANGTGTRLKQHAATHAPVAARHLERARQLEN